MKTVALLSGGKDSVMSVLLAMRHGHTPVVIANMEPGEEVDEVDSYMYQTVGHEVIEDLARCLELPLRRSTVVRNQAKDQSLLYTHAPPEDDEVEVLYRLLKTILVEFPEVRGVTSGAILSNYQRNRVECVCQRLGLVSLAYLWHQKAEDVLDMTVALHMRAILVKTASVALDPRVILGKTITEVRPTLEKVASMYGTHMAGEGGEFETLVLDCPLYKSYYLRLKEQKLVMVDSNEYAPSAHLVLRVERVEKTEEEKRVDAEVLRRLLKGEISFPSDRTAVFARVVERALPLWTHVKPKVLMHVPQVDGGIERYWDKSCIQLFLTSSTTPTKSREVECVVHEFLDRIRAWLGDDKVLVHIIVYLPNFIEFESAFRLAYEAATSSIDPPCFTMLGIRSEPGATPCFEVLAAPKPSSDARTANADVLHAQSRSSWATGCAGPYAQARRVAWSDGSSRVITSAVLGLVPESWTLARASDLMGIVPDNAAGRAMTTVTKSFIAQFIYAVWSAAAYGSVFAKDLCECTHVTVYVCATVLEEGDAASLIPALWTCFSEKKWEKVKGRILTVVALPHNAAVQILLEWCSEASS
ncbi:unnamed protein product [Phytomonas sp. Hart1]|nr:unnamed protein product [Phytomonas sp. Hart1]|eukprot:CCW70855.1 unnamed protein product [Phytomonas sp. isolate Hart1]